MHPIRRFQRVLAASLLRAWPVRARPCCAALALAVTMLASGCASVPGYPHHTDAAPGLSETPRISGALSRLIRSRPATAGDAHRSTGVPFEYHYAAPQSPELHEIHVRVREADLLRHLPELQAIDGVFALPRALRYVAAECGEPGAFYRPADTAVVLCYETLRTLYERGQQHQRFVGLGDDHPLRYTRANVRFIVLHETGHAFVDLLDLPVTGRQEDAVDQLAAILMLHFADLDETPEAVTANLRLAANWMLSYSTGAYDLHAFADEHALGEQRFFNLQCLIYGTDPVRFAGMIEAGDLTAARARGCVRETERVGRAWLRLLLPHVAPEYAMTEADALEYLRQRSGRPAPPRE